MQIILASAKIMNDKLKSVPDVSLSTPRFQSEANAFARDMAQYSAETIAEMLGCSQQIAAQNKLRFMQFFDDKPKLPAILAYHGQAYKHLKAETLNVDALHYSQGKLWITSFLYGLSVLWMVFCLIGWRDKWNSQVERDKLCSASGRAD